MDRLRKYGIRFFITIIIFITCVFVAIPIANCKAYGANSCGSIVMNSDYQILGGDNYNIRMPMASTTKVMTALLVIENCLMNEKVTVPKEAVGVEGSSIYLREGETLTVKELLYGLMRRSGNDSAVTLAIYVAGSENNFVAMMNERCKGLKLKNTNFCNPHGLHNDNHYTSCYDLCYISCYAMKDPIFREIVSTKSTSVGQNESRRYFQNKNKILKLYEGGNGIKTGFTKKSGRCLVASAERDGVLLVSVVLNHGDMWNDAINLLNIGFKQCGMQ